MTLIIDIASTGSRLSGDDVRYWAQEHTAFISSVMGELDAERQAVSRALRDLGMNVVMFEDLGGRDEDPHSAYLAGVGQSDIYIGIIADEYGTMLSSGFSPTHAEFLEARRLGRHISVWVKRDARNRAGHARGFVQEVRTFHTTGGFDAPGDLAEAIVRRVSELAADDASPWVKVGDAVFRADQIADNGREVEVIASIRDAAIARYLEGLRNTGLGGRATVRITHGDQTGSARVQNVRTVARSGMTREITLEGQWTGSDQQAVAFGTSGYTWADLVEIGVRVGVLGENPPAPFQGTGMQSMIDTTDPLEELTGMVISEAALEPIARLLLVESLVGNGRVRAIDRLTIGPPVAGGRRLFLAYVEASSAAERREIEGTRPLG
jgi:hypothetical protein